MVTGRDDFIIAIRSAFLKKSTQQKFSLLTLALISIFIIVLSSLDFKIIRYLKIGINEVVYRSSFVVSIPENFVKNTFFGITDYTTYFYEYKKNKDELNELKSNYVSNEIIQFENKELKELLNDYVSSSDKILAKIIVDHQSPFLKSIIINKGSKDKIKIGTNIYDQSYLVGRVIEVNFKTSRVLLLSDINSNVPVTIAPQNIQAIISGTGDNYGKIKYIKGNLSKNLTKDSIIYTSGTGALFKSGTPIGKLKVLENSNRVSLDVEFYSDYSQLKYVFAEIITKKEIINQEEEDNDLDDQNNTISAKLNILENEIEIIEDSNQKFKDENENLKNEIYNLNTKISQFENEINLQKEKINKLNIDTSELEFLRLNLEHGHKCRKTRKLFQKTTGFDPGSPEYRNCVIKKGIKNDG